MASGHAARTIIADRWLGVHECFSCKRTLDDEDFVGCGVGVLPQVHAYFDYHCRCSHRGRYIVRVECNAGPVEALNFLLTAVKNGEAKYRTDWDAMDWDHGGDT